MEPPPAPDTMTERDSDITATVVRERTKLVNFIRRRIRDPDDAEDILQDVFHEFVQAYRLPAPIEQASAWLFRAARNRIIDRFRKKKEQPLTDLSGDEDDASSEYRLDLSLPAHDAGPEALYARAVLLKALQDALDELPPMAEIRDIEDFDPQLTLAPIAPADEEDETMIALQTEAANEESADSAPEQSA